MHPKFNYFNIEWIDELEEQPFYYNEEEGEMMTFRHTLYLDEYELMEANKHYKEGGSEEDLYLIWNIPFSDQDIIARVKQTRVLFSCSHEVFFEILALHASGMEKKLLKNHLRALLEGWSYSIVEDDPDQLTFEIEEG